MLISQPTKRSARSLINSLASLPESQRLQTLQSLTKAERLALLFAWEGYARPEQVMPTGNWRVWLILAGRGWGKTRTGAEAVRRVVEIGIAKRVALVARTAADARDVMVEGESGLLRCCPGRMGAVYEPSKRRVTFANGALCTTYSADEPNLLRGPQHDFGWADELAAWSYADAWDQLKLGMRLGVTPRIVATTTPRPLKVIRDLIKDPATVVTRGNTYQNAQWLPASFLEDIRARFEGTRLGRQELMAELLEDVPGALWSRGQIDATRVRVCPPLARIEIGVDPAVTSGENSDETGIVVVGKGTDGQGYVLEDLSCRATPDSWARKVVEAYHRHKANRVVAEVNNGGDLVTSLIKTVDPRVTVLPVRASHGKRARAEPVAALYEQGKVHHVGTHPMLEDQQCFVAGTLVLTRRGEVPIEQVTTHDQALTRQGWRRVTWAGCTGLAETVKVRTDLGREIECTADHRLLVNGRFLPCRDAKAGDMVLECTSFSGTSSSQGFGTLKTRQTAISRAAVPMAGVSSIETSGNLSTVQSRPDGTSTTSTRTQRTTPSTISIPYRPRLTLPFTVHGDGTHSRASSAATRPRLDGLERFQGTTSVVTAESPTRPKAQSRPCSAPRSAESGSMQLVFDLTVEDQHEFFANRILVHNCQYTPDGYDGSPDHVDALVWALSSLMLGDQVASYNGGDVVLGSWGRRR